MRGHAYDALVGIAGCDKSLPGMMMAMVRLNVPSIFIYGGSILPGTFKGQQVTVQDVFEAVGKHSVGAMTDEDLFGLEQVACPSAGACGAQFTANTMAMVSEAIGLALPYSAGAPGALRNPRPLLHDRGRADHGPCARRTAAARHRHTKVIGKRRGNGGGIRRLDQCGAASACNRSRMRHRVHLFDVAEVFKRTPYIADLKPGGRYVAKDLFEAGGIPLLMKTLLDDGYLHGDCMTVTGRTIAENLKTREMESRSGRGASRQQAAFRQPAASWA